MALGTDPAWAYTYPELKNSFLRWRLICCTDFKDLAALP